jgi:hypothetical protein
MRFYVIKRDKILAETIEKEYFFFWSIKRLLDYMLSRIKNKYRGYKRQIRIKFKKRMCKYTKMSEISKNKW